MGPKLLGVGVGTPSANLNVLLATVELNGKLATFAAIAVLKKLSSAVFASEDAD
jgi:hypothetical protein